MIAKAPGKLVVSGAYSVLEGAPAIVVAVDRYAVADTARAPDRVKVSYTAVSGSSAKAATWIAARSKRPRRPGVAGRLTLPTR